MSLHNLVYPMYLMDKPSGKHTGRLQCNERITQTHLLKLNSTRNKPRIELLEGPFVHGCQAAEKKVLGYILHGFLYRRECTVSDMGNSPHHLTDICYDVFYRSGTVNSKSFVGKVLLRIKWKFELTVYFKHGILGKL